MLLYSETITTRLQYIATTIFPLIEYTNNATTFVQYSGAKINYSDSKISDNECWIIPHTLLFETNIKEQSIAIFNWQNLPAFFKTGGTIPFDYLAASFYLLTRYEESLPHEKDEYNRYAHTNSIAYKNNFLHLPLINLWVEKIKPKFPKLNIEPSHFKFIPTYDIDIAYAYNNQPIVKNVAGFFKNILQGKLDIAQERLSVLGNSKTDPFDVYEWLQQLHSTKNEAAIYFFLVADKRSEYDKNISPKQKSIQQLIQKIATNNLVGVHPSWLSNANTNLLFNEVKTITQITQQPCLHSRQHYIQFSLPATYKNLIAAGITNDYSMGYGSINGFRASYTLPFTWYNLQEDCITNLTIHPFCYMDANAIFEEKLSPQQALQQLQQYYNIVKQVDGSFYMIHHNHFLAMQPQWQVWRDVYENFLHQNKL